MTDQQAAENWREAQAVGMDEQEEEMERNFAMIGRAEYQVMLEFREFAARIKDADTEWYFDPRNRDEWVRSFCNWLAEKQRRSAEVRASND